MDPFSALGLAANIIQFIDFTASLVSSAHDIYSSATGNSSDNENLEFVSREMKSLCSQLEASQPTFLMSPDEKSLRELASQCHSLAEDILDLMLELRSSNPKSKRDSFRTAWRNVRKKKEKKELEDRLDRCRQQLDIQLAKMTRLADIVIKSFLC